ncbi:MAG TPA: AAA family ATPase [Leptolyngbyaceae cyanobacterium M33_DOE_097]|uniref:Nuclease SbcCD subunit C n=1 Tax=Oscillatoriales cyanobacterium SpSt-418 TaxID=2282169 RepID=A0A7C3KI69_9CYAN|nr:AAA family ATPase [Leptolyngbyaceae cyanobacterium M33_DOE_097]
MIPLRLTLKNFLSYREATLDFSGLHTACISGANGAGKSSLLEAIAWAVWGVSRATSEDDVIHTGMAEAQVDFLFTTNQHVYRVLRSRTRSQGTTLEFQVAFHASVDQSVDNPETNETSVGQRPAIAEPDRYFAPGTESLLFRSLTAKGIRATQQLIIDHIKLDYDTFINSAYLRQGHADEFMLKRASDRKQVLADLLKLDQYDDLAERAKDQARQLKGKLDVLEQNLKMVEVALHEQQQVTPQWETLEAAVEQMQQAQAADAERLKALQNQVRQQQAWQQQLSLCEQQQRQGKQEGQRLQQELTALNEQVQKLVSVLQQEPAIAAGFAQLQALQAQEEAFASRFDRYQHLHNQRQQVQQKNQAAIAQLHVQLQQSQARHEALLAQMQDVQQTLEKAPEIETALARLQQARTQLTQLDRLQLKVAPLQQRRQQVQTQLEREQAKLTARFDELTHAIAQLQAQHAAQPQLQQAVVEISDRIARLEQQRHYLEQIREKGLERRSFMERLQADQRHYETQLAEVEQTIQGLQAVTNAQAVEVLQPTSPEVQPVKAKKKRRDRPQRSLVRDATNAVYGNQYLLNIYPEIPAIDDGVTLSVCPLCDRPLDAQHRQFALTKHQSRRQEILNQLWTIREQLAVSERELQLLREEYQAIDAEMANYTAALEQRGHLQAQLQTAADGQAALQTLIAEAAEIERSLQANNYATPLWEELNLLDQRLQELNYDERNHALARGEADRWRWADSRASEIRHAQRKQVKLAEQLPQLQAEIEQLQQQLQQAQLKAQQQCQHLDQQIRAIAYDAEQHQQLRHQIKQAQAWQLHRQELERAKQHYPLAQQQGQQLLQQIQDHQQKQDQLQAEITNLKHCLQEQSSGIATAQAIETQMQTRRSHLDEQLAQLGRLQQQQQQLEALQAQLTQSQQQVTITQRQYRIYQELAQAFGRNGIQTLMIENVLPPLEAETNRILSRLSANQLHVQFVTQKSSRDNAKKAKNSRLIETLDILIADAKGTRPYETYSGGEAFRVNFAIRLALAKLLAQRAGTALQMLIIDEGFGTQDAEGCNRLIAAINAIAPDFACILTVTHVSHFKEAFQARIEVTKTETGSHLQLSI